MTEDCPTSQKTQYGYISPAEAEDNYYRQLANSQETIVST